jgi:hypothetical protein
MSGREFPEVIGVAVPEMAETVAAAMADKYWMDFFVHLVNHPLTLRLDPK